MNTFRNLIYFLPLILLSNHLWAANSTELAIFPLQHKLAQDLVKQIKPLVGKDGSVSAFSGKLIVRAPSNQLEEIRWLISELDQAAANLLIEVSVGVKRQDNHQAIGASGTLSTQNAHGKIIAHQANTRNNQTSQQRIRTLDGHAALIQVGESVPIHQITQSNFAGVNTQSYELKYRDLNRGFYALPHLHGDQVTIEIYQEAEHRSNRTGQFNSQSASTVVSGNLGNWLEIGGIGEQGKYKQSSLGYSISTRKHDDNHIYLRVTRVD